MTDGWDPWGRNWPAWRWGVWMAVRVAIGLLGLQFLIRLGQHAPLALTVLLIVTVGYLILAVRSLPRARGCQFCGRPAIMVPSSAPPPAWSLAGHEVFWLCPDHFQQHLEGRGGGDHGGST